MRKPHFKTEITRDEIQKVDDFRMAFRWLYETGIQPGVRTGWPSLDPYYTVRPREWTLITGIPGHGKTSLLDGLMVNLARREDWRWAVFSAENLPVERHASDLAAQYIGRPFNLGLRTRITEEEFHWASMFLDAHFTWLNPPESDCTVDRILMLTDMLCGHGAGIQGLVIDPWNELEHRRPSGVSETEYVSEVLSRIRRFAREHEIHVFLVAHPTKLQRIKTARVDGTEAQTYPVPTPYDVSGCHDEATEVLTSRGWVAHRDVSLLDYVCCFNPRNGLLGYQRPTKVWCYDFDGDMMRIKSPSFDALVTPNHRMVVDSSWQKKPSFTSNYKGTGYGRPQKYGTGWVFVEAQDLKSGLVMPWASSFWMDADPDYNVSDDALRFIGWWIAEGWVTQGSIALCQAVGPLAKRMRECIERLGVAFTDRVTHYREHEQPMWTARLAVRYDEPTNVFAKMVIAECGSGAESKRLPSFTWRLSCRQKWVLLRAYLEGDGSVGRRDTFRAHTTSPILADQIQRLSIELGRMAVLSSQEGVKAHHKRRYQVTIGREDRKTITLRVPRHVTKEPYKGKVYCLTVPTGAYLVRRNGKPGIYGNSAHWRNKADNCITVWRDVSQPEYGVDIHVQKIRFREIGQLGCVHMGHDRPTNQLIDPLAPFAKWQPPEVDVQRLAEAVGVSVGREPGCDDE